MSFHPIPQSVRQAINILGDRANYRHLKGDNEYFLDGQKVPFMRLIDAAGTKVKLTPIAEDLR